MLWGDSNPPWIKTRVRNATILNQYADTLKQQKPEYSALIDALAKDATTTGPLFINLSQRLQDVRNRPESFTDWREQLDELIAIEEAASLSLYGDALSDSINVLADMSGGALPRVNAVSRESEIAANKSQDMGPAAAMVGNPNYGQWTTGSNGMSFWEWYGMYSLFNNLFNYGGVSYDHWGRHRGYSYYHDYGRSRYSSPKQRKAQQSLYTKTQKSFASRGQTFKGPYSKKRTGASSLSRSSYTPQRKSSFSKGSSYSRSSGSVRSGSSRTSRGTSRGK